MGIIDYRVFFQKAIQQVKSIREPRASDPSFIDLEWPLVEQNELFSFEDSTINEQKLVAESAKKISVSILFKIIHALFDIKHWKTEAFVPDSLDPKQKALLVIHDFSNEIMYIFHEKPDSPMWRLKGKETKDVQDLLDARKVSTCKHIYLLSDYAFMLVVGHNNDIEDPGRGYNVYSIKWFWETLFGEEEYRCFSDALAEYKKEVNEYLGFICVKSLTSSSLIGFRRIVEHHIRCFDYAQLLQRVMMSRDRSFYLGHEELNLLLSQYIDGRCFELLLANNDFSESLITAEWLYDSMKKARAIDLTAIGMGYFKAVEQLLYALICLHKNEGRLIRKDFSRQDLPTNIELCDHYIEEKAIDTTIGSMAIFVKDNLGIFRSDLKWPTKYYLREFVFKYRELRNGYLHKDNIHSWDKINEIRNDSFLLIFLLIGAFSFTDDSLESMGMPDKNRFDDYYYLCEYVNYHSGWFFCIKNGDFEDYFVACNDIHSKVIDNQYIEYSGLYFRNLGKDGMCFKLDRRNMPEEIYVGKLLFDNTELVSVNPVKIRKIYDRGTFIGPTISEEMSVGY